MGDHLSASLRPSSKPCALRLRTASSACAPTVGSCWLQCHTKTASHRNIDGGPAIAVGAGAPGVCRLHFLTFARLAPLLLSQRLRPPARGDVATYQREEWNVGGPRIGRAPVQATDLRLVFASMRTRR